MPVTLWYLPLEFPLACEYSFVEMQEAFICVFYTKDNALKTLLANN